ncbi:hypothetical protein SLL00_16545 [Metabacillus indicus]|uniref:hypothetical protein n=1 Tax=Metabacillus indicus TaxID=246786 RepID=UPI002A043B9C|nr:hypothetical protein [Metabacillus indicus]MDX8291421.1 hypothetical protein [Metabacillus indicus]
MPSLKSSLGSSPYVSLDEVCSLLSMHTVKDELNQNISTPIERQVFCSKISISRAEFSAAGQLNHKPQIVLLIDSDEYDYEKKLKFEDVTYTAYRHFQRSDGYTEVYCEVRAGG